MTRKKQVDKNVTKSDANNNNNRKYKVKIISNSAYKRVSRLSTKTLLSGFLKNLFKKRTYLKFGIGYLAPEKTYKLIL